MSFDDIVGHERVLEPLWRALAADRLHPSLLFHGPEGVGKRLAAFALAAALNCAVAPGAGCGACASCRRIRRGYDEVRIPAAGGLRAPGHHADVLFYPPRRRQIVLEQIQDLCRETGFRPFEGRRRALLVDPADRMNREAANALLKTLEEPPASACIILITARPDALPATIQSRCQAVRFTPLPTKALTDLLVQRGEEATCAGRRARLAEGSVGRALALDLEAHDRVRDRLLGALEGGELLPALGLAAEFADSAEAFEGMAGVLGSLLRDLAVLAVGADPASLVHADVAERLRPLAARLAGRAAETMARLEDGIRRVRGNVNPRLAAEAILVPLVAGPGR